MDNLVVLIFIGFAIGSIGTLIGAGGGFLLVPLLLLSFPQLSPEIVTAVSIAVVAVNAVSGTLAYAAAKRIDYKAGFIFGLFTIPGSIIGVYLVEFIPLHIFKILFGVLLIVLAIFLFIRKNNRKVIQNSPFLNLKKVQHVLVDKSGNEYRYSFNKMVGIIISLVVGLISPILGIGGGVIHVPAMVAWLQFPVYVATATSHFILAMMTSVSVLIHWIEGSYNDILTQKLLLGLCIGVIPGAQLGAYISHKLNTGIIIRILAICLMLVGLRIIF